jgi:hypothetical protein
MQTFRRTESGALVNTDKSATAAYKTNRERAKKLETDINTLNTKVMELESMIQQLIRGTHVIS